MTILSPPNQDTEQVPSRASKLGDLAERIRNIETADRPQGSWIATGCAAMDQVLPGGGYAAGSMIELVCDATGIGAMSIAMAIARSAIADSKYVMVVDRERQFYPPALLSFGIPMERVLILQPTTDADAIWGLDQALRCPAVGASIATVHRLDDRVARRLQLATEQGGGLGMLLRDPIAARQQPSWADVQWRVQSAKAWEPRTRVRWIDLELMRASGGRAGSRMRVGLDSQGNWMECPHTIRGQHERAGSMHLAAQLAKPTNRRRELAG